MTPQQAKKELSLLATHLRNLRVDCKLTQVQLSKATGIAQTTICNYEKGARVPSIENLIQIARALGVELHVLLDFRYLK
jgi:transcriptional regulator with XRE-family HTH domain